MMHDPWGSMDQTPVTLILALARFPCNVYLFSCCLSNRIAILSDVASPMAFLPPFSRSFWGQTPPISMLIRP